MIERELCAGKSEVKLKKNKYFETLAPSHRLICITKQPPYFNGEL